MIHDYLNLNVNLLQPLKEAAMGRHNLMVQYSDKGSDKIIKVLIKLLFLAIPSTSVYLYESSMQKCYHAEKVNAFYSLKRNND